MLRTFRSSITSLMSSSLILRLGLWRGRRVCAVSPSFPFAFIFIVSFCLSVEAISMNLTINYLYQNRISNPETSYKMGIFLFFLLPSGFFKEPKSLSSKCYRLVALILFPVPGMEPSFKPLAHGPCLRIGNPLICIHSLLENMTFISMNHSASRFYLLLNLSCFAARAAADSPVIA